MSCWNRGRTTQEQVGASCPFDWWWRNIQVRRQQRTALLLFVPCVYCTSFGVHWHDVEICFHTHVDVLARTQSTRFQPCHSRCDGADRRKEGNNGSKGNEEGRKSSECNKGDRHIIIIATSSPPRHSQCTVFSCSAAASESKAVQNMIGRSTTPIRNIPKGN